MSITKLVPVAKGESDALQMTGTKIAKSVNDVIDLAESVHQNYSTTEQNTGLKWIDNKDVYERTLIATYTSSVDNLTILSGIDTLINTNGTVGNGSGEWYPFVGREETYTMKCFSITKPSGIVKLYTGTAVTGIRLIFRYTKK